MFRKILSCNVVLLMSAVTLCLSSCGEDSQPAGEEGARALIQEMIDNPSDAKELSKKLRPTSEDYAAVFSDADFAKNAERVYNEAWDAGQMIVVGKPGQTEMLIFSATTDDLQAWNEKSKPFPGGYKSVASKFNKGLTIYHFKLIEPGETLGMAYNGLIHVNGKWRIFPKPWRTVRK